MSRRRSGKNAEGQTAVAVARWPQTCVAGFVVVEVFTATLFVVGLFDAAFQTLSWSSGVEFALSASLGIVLWLADRGLAELDSATCTEGVAAKSCSRRTAVQDAVKA